MLWRRERGLQAPVYKSDKTGRDPPVGLWFAANIGEEIDPMWIP